MRDIEVTIKITVTDGGEIDFGELTMDIINGVESNGWKNIEITEIRDSKKGNSKQKVMLEADDAEVIAGILEMDADQVMQDIGTREMYLEDTLADLGTADRLRRMSMEIYEQIGQEGEANRLYEMIPEAGPNGIIGIDWPMLKMLDGEFGERRVEDAEWDCSPEDGIIIELEEAGETVQVYISLKDIDDTCNMGKDMICMHKLKQRIIEEFSGQ